jgi:hypothetical protein
MSFTTLGDVYEVVFRVSKKVGGVWVADPQNSGQQGKHNVVAASEANAASIVQAYMGHDNVATRVECHGGVRKIMTSVIIAA